MRRPVIGKVSINGVPPHPLMQECQAHTYVQRALHALILEDNTSAVVYLRRALCCLEEEEETGGRSGGGSRNIKRRKSAFSNSFTEEGWFSSL